MDDRFESRGGRDDREQPNGHRDPPRRAPGSHEHPMVERSGRSRSTWVVLAAAMIVAAAVYAAITLGIAGAG